MATKTKEESKIYFRRNNGSIGSEFEVWDRRNYKGYTRQEAIDELVKRGYTILGKGEYEAQLFAFEIDFVHTNLEYKNYYSIIVCCLPRALQSYRTRKVDSERLRLAVKATSIVLGIALDSDPHTRALQLIQFFKGKLTEKQQEEILKYWVNPA